MPVERVNANWPLQKLMRKARDFELKVAECGLAVLSGAKVSL